MEWSFVWQINSHLHEWYICPRDDGISARKSFRARCDIDWCCCLRVQSVTPPVAIHTATGGSLSADAHCMWLSGSAGEPALHALFAGCLDWQGCKSGVTDATVADHGVTETLSVVDWRCTVTLQWTLYPAIGIRFHGEQSVRDDNNNNDDSHGIKARKATVRSSSLSLKALSAIGTLISSFTFMFLSCP